MFCVPFKPLAKSFQVFCVLELNLSSLLVEVLKVGEQGELPLRPQVEARVLLRQLLPNLWIKEKQEAVEP